MPLDLATLRADSVTELNNIATDQLPTGPIEKKDARHEIKQLQAQMAKLQERLHAQSRQSMLLVLQGMDTSGKDGTIRHACNALNPLGVGVFAFGVPSEEELDHDFLWRIHHHTPPRGGISIFNRSHYEDVLVVRVKNLVPKETWSERYDIINEFEASLAAAKTKVVKVFLNISLEEQGKRLQDRIDQPDKNWKFRKGDLEDRALWPDFMNAYQEMLQKTSTDHAPWYVVPSDRKWLRNYCVSHIIVNQLTQMDPQFPPADETLSGLKVT